MNRTKRQFMGSEQSKNRSFQYVWSKRYFKSMLNYSLKIKGYHLFLTYGFNLVRNTDGFLFYLVHLFLNNSISKMLDIASVS